MSLFTQKHSYHEFEKTHFSLSLMFFVCHFFMIFPFCLSYFSVQTKIQFDGFYVYVFFLRTTDKNKNIFHISHIFLSQRNINHIFISHIFRNIPKKKTENLHLFKPSNIDNLYRKIKYWVVSFFHVFFYSFSSSSFMNVLFYTYKYIYILFNVQPLQMHDSICFTIFFFVWYFLKSSDGSVTNGSRKFCYIIDS